MALAQKNTVLIYALRLVHKYRHKGRCIVTSPCSYRSQQRQVNKATPLERIRVPRPLERSKIGKRQLVTEGQRHARVLQHVVERQVLDQVLGRVDVVVRVLERRLDDKRRRVPGLGRRRVVGAGIAALGLDVGDVTVLRVIYG